MAGRRDSATLIGFAPRSPTAWHGRPATKVLRNLDGSGAGLTASEAGLVVVAITWRPFRRPPAAAAS